MKLAEKLPAVAVVAVLVGGFAIMIGNFNPSAEEPLDVAELMIPDLSAAAQRGKAAFDANCLACHGQNATGSDLGPPLINRIYNPGHHSDMAFYLAGRQGTRQHHWDFGDMPAQPQVSEDQMTAIIQYVREMQAANGIVTEPHTM